MLDRPPEVDDGRNPGVYENGEETHSHPANDQPEEDVDVVQIPPPGNASEGPFKTAVVV